MTIEQPCTQPIRKYMCRKKVYDHLIDMAPILMRDSWHGVWISSLGEAMTCHFSLSQKKQDIQYRNPQGVWFFLPSRYCWCWCCCLHLLLEVG